MPASACPSPSGHARSRRRWVSAAWLALAIASLFPVTVQAAPAPPDRAFVADQAAPGLSLAAIVAEAAQRYGIPESWIGAVMRVESAGNPRAVSPKGAMGLMQLMPATWARMTARYGLGGDPFNVRANVHAGAAYLREMFDRYRDLPTALAAYNAGPGRADDWRWRGRPLPAETTVYVARIAPTSGTSGVAPLAAVPEIAPINPLRSWRASGLFSVPSSVSSSTVVDAADASPGVQSDGIPPVAHRAPFSASTRQGGSLFAPVSGQSAP